MVKKGYKQTEETKIKRGLYNKGEKNHSWKGNNIGIIGIHLWLRREYGSANKCENPECKHISKKFHWAKLKGKEYERKRENFWRLCVSCHRIYDGVGIGNTNGFKKGKAPWNKNKKCPSISVAAKKRFTNPEEREKVRIRMLGNKNGIKKINMKKLSIGELSILLGYKPKEVKNIKQNASNHFVVEFSNGEKKVIQTKNRYVLRDDSK